MKVITKIMLSGSTLSLSLAGGVAAQMQPTYGNTDALLALFEAAPVVAAPIDTTIPVGNQTPAPDSGSAGTSSGGGFLDWLTGSSAGSTGSSNQGTPQAPTAPTAPTVPTVPTPSAPDIPGAAPAAPPAPTPAGAGGLAGPGSLGGNGEVGGVGSSLAGLTGRAGIAYASWPDYFGADTGRNPVELFVDATFGANGFLNNEDGLGLVLLSLGSLESKISLNRAYGQRFIGKTSGLTAMKRYNQVEADVTLQTLNWQYEAELALPLSGPDGWTLTGSMMQTGPLGTYGTWDATLGVTYASQDWMNSYYGISAAEATASGLSAYAPGGGVRDIFVDTGVDIPLSDAWGLDVDMGARYMMGDARNSPQVKDAGSKTDYLGHVAVYYRF